MSVKFNSTQLQTINQARDTFKRAQILSKDKDQHVEALQLFKDTINLLIDSDVLDEDPHQYLLLARAYFEMVKLYPADSPSIKKVNSSLKLVLQQATWMIPQSQCGKRIVREIAEMKASLSEDHDGVSLRQKKRRCTPTEIT